MARPGLEDQTLGDFPEFGSLEVQSHSYGAYFNVSHLNFAWQNVLARLIGADVVRNLAVAGSKTYLGGYGKVNEYLGRGRSAGPYFAPAGAGAVLLGTNDWPTANYAAVQAGIRNIICKLRASRIMEESDGAWAFSSGSSGVAAPDSGMSGGSRWAITANGSTATLTVPADCHRNASVAIAIGSITSTDAFTVAWTKNGVAAGSDVVTAGLYSGEAQNYHFNKRFTQINPGDVIVATFSGITGTVRIDFATIEAEFPQPVVVGNVPRLPGNFSALSGLASKWAGINAAIAAAVAEFDVQVQVVDLDAACGQGDTAFFSGDLIHPNDRGHFAIAKAFAAQLRRMILPPAFDYGGVADTGNLGLFNGWTQVSGEAAPRYRVTPDGLVLLTGRLEHLSTGPALGQTVALLPVNARPRDQVTVMAVGDAATAAPAVWQITSLGVVKYAGGSIATGAKASLDGVAFQAER